MGIPCVTLRDNTERPETVECGGNILAGTDSDEILKAVERMIDLRVSGGDSWKNPFGDGCSSERIVDACLRDLQFD